MSQPVSVVVPVYNEASSVAKVLSHLKEVMDNLNVGYEIIAVNDTSTDSSLKSLKTVEGIKVISHHYNKGYGASLKTGITNAKYDLILITDCDGTYPAEDIPRLYKYTKEYDMVVGARTGKNVHIPLLRKPAKMILKVVASYVAGMEIPDLNSGLRFFKKDLALRFWNLMPQRFSFTSTITMAAITNGYEVKFLPINYNKRRGKSSIHPIKDFLGFNKLLLKLCLFFRPLRIFIPASIIFMLLSAFIAWYSTFVMGKILDITVTLIFILSVQVFFFGLIAEQIARKGGMGQ